MLEGTRLLSPVELIAREVTLIELRRDLVGVVLVDDVSAEAETRELSFDRFGSTASK